MAWTIEGFLFSWGTPEYGKLGHPIDKSIVYGEEILPR
jgi:hypothetical protein